MSASALPGRRVEWYLAGMTATAETESVGNTGEEEGPVLSTGGTNNLNTGVLACYHATERNSR